MTDNHHDFSHDLSPAEHERLSMLLEELGEAQQIIGKILRHGYESVDPTRRDAPTNRRMLQKEIGDVRAVLEMMFAADDIDRSAVADRIRPKLQQLQRYGHHNDELLDLVMSSGVPGAPTR
jgi:hypothetical protein